MKKIIIILAVILLSTGCSSNKETYKTEVNKVNDSNQTNVVTSTPSCH